MSKHILSLDKKLRKIKLDIYFNRLKVEQKLDKLFNYIPTETSFTPLRDLKDVPSKPIKMELIKK